MRSLTIPSSQGGVMLERPYGPVLEEYPNEIPVYILNGWTTALVAILGYADEPATGTRVTSRSPGSRRCWRSSTASTYRSWRTPATRSPGPRGCA